MKVLNLYAGIGGNRKLWTDCEVTAIEYDEKIAAIYKDLYPNDTVIVADAHQYLLDHYKEYDFVWGSPPCPTHSVTNNFLNAQGIIRYPDMSLYQEIIFLQHFFEGKYVIENVKSYYEPLIKPQEIGRHYFWSNFKLPKINGMGGGIGRMSGKKIDLGYIQADLRDTKLHLLGFDLSGYDVSKRDKVKMLRNCVKPEIGLIIFNTARGIVEHNKQTQQQLF